jgi:hypothetical protein
MTIPRSLHGWLRLPSRIALLLGLGALSAAGARADAPDAKPDGSVGPLYGDVLIRSEGGKIFLSERGRDFEELQVKDTAEVRNLKKLLDDHEGAVVRVNPMMVADSGAGFMWPTPEKTSAPDKATPRQPAAPADTETTKKGKSEGTDRPPPK